MTKNSAYVIRLYDPVPEIEIVTCEDKSSYALPESALIAFLSTIVNGEIDWFLNSWTTRSRVYFEEEILKKLKITHEHLLASWRSQYTDVKIEFIRRIELKDFIVIEIRKTMTGDEPDVEDECIPLVLENGQWKVTQEFKLAPVGFNWWDNERAVKEAVESRKETEGVLDYSFKNFSGDESDILKRYPEPLFPTRNLIVKRVMKRFRYHTMDYDPPAAITIMKDSKKASYMSPENALSAHISAIVSHDFDWYLASWLESDREDMKSTFFRSLLDPEEDKEIQQFPDHQGYFPAETPEWQWYFEGWPPSLMHKKQNVKPISITADEMIDAWKLYFFGKTMVLNRRVDRGNYAILEYAVNGESGSGQSMTFSLPFEKEGGEWKVTQALSNDPIFHWWNNESAARKAGYEIRVVE